MKLDTYTLLVVDDEPDVFTMTQLALRDLTYDGKPVNLEVAHSAEEAREFLKSNAQTAVILLDVVMEHSSAGLELCRWLREDAHNDMTRVLLRTGQPGAAPEKQVIDEYEIDGYLSKSEMTKTRLYSAVKTGLKTYTELYRARILEQSLAYLHEVVMELHNMTEREPLLQKITESACVLSGAPIALFYLSHPPTDEAYLLFAATDMELEPQSRVDEIIRELNQEDPQLVGSIVPLPMETGEGWFYFDAPLQEDPIAQKVLPMMAAHAVQVVGL